jgi:hypothetical protein
MQHATGVVNRLAKQGIANDQRLLPLRLNLCRAKNNFQIFQQLFNDWQRPNQNAPPPPPNLRPVFPMADLCAALSQVAARTLRRDTNRHASQEYSSPKSCLYC